MRYNESTGKLEISSKEFVTVARRGISVSLPFDDEAPTASDASRRLLSRVLADHKRECVLYPFSFSEYEFVLYASVDKADGDDLWFVTVTDTDPRRVRKECIAQASGNAYVCAYAYMNEKGTRRVKLNYIYANEDRDDILEKEEILTYEKAERFFNRCITSVSIYARPEVERVTLRAPSMRSLKFPYKSIREGQSEFVRAAYRSIARGTTLFATAPTGTGKTVSVLFPAIKAMGEGHCDKIFYLTPKTTTAIAAAECIELLSKSGAIIRSVIISAKERICSMGLVCRESKNRCEYMKCNRLADALLKLYKEEITVVTKDKIARVSNEFKVCPYELSLAYAEVCDVVICDFNYLFDPVVYIRRFFTEGGNYAFLVDEAHNLPDRAREMYSADICEEDIVLPALTDLLSEFSETKKAARECGEEFFDTLYPFVKEEIRLDADGNKVAATHLSEIPSALYPIFESLIATVEGEIFKTYAATDEEKEERLKLLRNYYYKLKKFYSVMAKFDSSYEMFIFYQNDRISTKLFCIDTAGEISERISKGRSAIFFSATLTPLYYYKSVLGGDRSADTLEVDSPFDPSQLSVSVMDKISTRFLERDDTLLAVSRVIAATISAKRGNYMVFTPSFDYAQALSDTFKAKYPKLRVLTQKRNMTKKEKDDFLLEFSKDDRSYLVGFCVMGGIYSEGIDLAGDSLIGAVIVGIGMPSLSYEREAICAYYDERFEEGKQFSYIYPGMNRVLQAAGRVIRREDDKGVIVLVDDRFDDPIYKKVIPKLWHGMKFIADAKELKADLDEFWKEEK